MILHGSPRSLFSSIIQTSTYRAIAIGINDDFTHTPDGRIQTAFPGAMQGIRARPHGRDHALRPG
ncbi:hypothetical protein C3743_13635 [Burkholderia contaminans]|uniref:Uncharacterized protein n=1 Tax=Burkholderia contaminans TaxID=488447 RepID=A0A2S5E7Q5_9BURK|nr:hypothetical protein C3743_13635 [Burkholderia contaminans]